VGFDNLDPTVRLIGADRTGIRGRLGNPIGSFLKISEVLLDGADQGTAVASNRQQGAERSTVDQAIRAEHERFSAKTA
jgi:hypothetical protein